MPKPLLRWLPLALLILAALGLRTRDLAARPMHADEANQAVKAGELLLDYLEEERVQMADHGLRHGVIYAGGDHAGSRSEKKAPRRLEGSVRLRHHVQFSSGGLQAGLATGPMQPPCGHP